LIVCRTPFRVSFFGGGTDYPVWYQEHGGKVVGTTIQQYGYVAVQSPLPLFDYQFHLRYSTDERVNTVADIQHPSIRECLNYLHMFTALDLTYTGDLPAMSGMGTSSAFTVGCLHALHSLRNEMITPHRLALEALEIEHFYIKEAVGSQDQILTAHGGLRTVEFGPEIHDYKTAPLIVYPATIDKLESWLMMIFTGFQRRASKIAQVQIDETPHKKGELFRIAELTNDAIETLSRPAFDIVWFGKLLDEAWKVKRTITDRITNPNIDDIYRKAKRAGAIGARLMGAGSGGFFLLCAHPERHHAIKEALRPLVSIPFRMDKQGSSIVMYNPAAEAA
jgi:D-glycero-alpha-D-manno-heptose-7-phosphate kinase